MTIHEASRTLLKSPPELWAECSDATSLNRHLDQFGEIRITRLEPETAVAWEGENACGTVRLEPSGWGTRVILTAEEVDPVVDQSPVPVAVAEESRVAVVQAQPEPAVVEPEPEPAVVEPEPEPEPHAGEPEPVEPDPPAPEHEPDPPALRGGFFSRLMARMRGPAPVVGRPTPEPVAEPASVEAASVEPASVEPASVEPASVEPASVEPASVELEYAEPEPTAPEPATPQPSAETLEPEPTVDVREAAESPGGPEASEPREPGASEPTAAPPLAALTDALNSLGMAHHRPFSRS